MLEKPSMQEILHKYGYKPNRCGYISCPFHGNEKTPSLKIYHNGRGWYCFSCHSGGDSINFVMRMENCDFKQAIEAVGIKDEYKPQPNIKRINKIVENIIAIRQRLQLERDSQFNQRWLQHKRLRQSPPSEEFWDNLSNLLNTEEYTYHGI